MMRIAKRHRALLIARSLVLLAAGGCAFLAFAVWDIYGKERAAKEKAAAVAEELDALRERRDTLSGTLDSLNTKEGLEGEIRETLQMAKEGERMVVIVDRTPSAPAPAPERAGFWHALTSWFGL
jgi:cell division protein FtsB